MKRTRGFVVTAAVCAIVVSLFIAGCTDKGTEPVDTHAGDEELEFTLSFNTLELETLDDTTLLLSIHDHHGEPMMEFDDVEMQYRMEGTVEWASIPMTMSGDHFEGNHTFVSSGEYEMRAMGVPHHGDGHGHDPEELHLMNEHYHVHRAYVDAGGYRVEYESFPGHIHSGESATLKFWVVDRNTDLAAGNLSPNIRCLETGGVEHVVGATESMAGVYEIDHIVDMAGATAMSLLFTGSDSSPAEAVFDITVSAAH